MEKQQESRNEYYRYYNRLKKELNPELVKAKKQIYNRRAYQKQRELVRFAREIKAQSELPT